MNDPIVDEIRQVRRRIFEECGGDLGCLIERLKSAEKDEDRLATLEEIRQRALTSKPAR